MEVEEEDGMVEAGQSSGRLPDSKETASQHAESQFKGRSERKGRV